ncbi:MAG: DUF1576 domain-containing protein [Spirochaetales bacterium]|nr:DUF1576 domain-containing protein [Spirochaetales bacterium]
MANKEISNHTFLLIILSFLLTGMILTGLVESGFYETIRGFAEIQVHPARLINDYIEIAGIGGALLNGALVGFVGLILILLSRIPLSGPTFAAVLTMTGFGLFGKTPLNILPVFLGVYLSARLVGKRLRDYLMIALFGTALAPLVSTLAWELGLSPVPAILAGTAGGVVTGFFLPSIAVSMLHLHQGYNLYNMGLTCGFFGLFAAAVLRGFGHEYAGTFFWYEGSSPFLTMLVPALSLLLILGGIQRDGRKMWSSFREILTIPGRLPSDFIDLVSAGGTLFNSGLIGLAGSLYIYLIGAPFNGAVIGGLLTIMGFGAFGTHIANAWPVVTGVIIATVATGNSLSSPGPVLAAIFSTTLAPLAGEFGIPVGLAAGMIHLLMVLQTGSWHGGMNLYNNGFAGGLTASLIIAVIQWYRTNKEEF